MTPESSLKIPVKRCLSCACWLCTWTPVLSKELCEGLVSGKTVQKEQLVGSSISFLEPHIVSSRVSMILQCFVMLLFTYADSKFDESSTIPKWFKSETILEEFWETREQNVRSCFGPVLRPAVVVSSSSVYAKPKCYIACTSLRNLSEIKSGIVCWKQTVCRYWNLLLSPEDSILH